MTATTSNSLPRVDTAQIASLRTLLDRCAALKRIAGDFVQFRVVVDANFIVRELTHRIRYPARTTALEEMIRATIVEAYAPRWLETEMASAIPQVAKRRQIPENALWAQWRTYRQIIRWDERFSTPRDHASGDPKDTPYLDLEDSITADGILSEDADIKAMGGHPLTLQFVLSTRRYARAAVIGVNVRLMGVLISLLAVTAVVAIIDAIRGISPEVSALLAFGAILALLLPTVRECVGNIATMIGDLLSSAGGALLDVIVAAVALIRDAEAESGGALALASAEIRPKS